MSEIIKFGDIKIGDTIRVTRTPETEPGYLTIEQGVVAYIKSSDGRYGYVDDQYGNTLADTYSDDEAVIELIDRPKELFKVGGCDLDCGVQGHPVRYSGRCDAGRLCVARVARSGSRR